MKLAKLILAHEAAEDAHTDACCAGVLVTDSKRWHDLFGAESVARRDMQRALLVGPLPSEIADAAHAYLAWQGLHALACKLDVGSDARPMTLRAAAIGSPALEELRAWAHAQEASHAA